MESTCQPYNDNVFGPIVHGCRSNFDFTLLFEQCILSSAPAALLLLFAPPRLVKLMRSSKKTLPSRLRLSKSIFALLLIGVQLALLICWSSDQVTRVTVPSAVLSFLAVCAILLLSRLEHSRSVRPSFILNVYLFASSVFDAVQVRTLFLRHDKPAILGLFTANIAIKLALLILESKSKRKCLRPPYNNFSPEATSGIFNRSFFWWINPILATGFRTLITLDDLFATDSSLESDVLLEEMKISWSKYRASGRYGLCYASFHCLRWKLAANILPRLCLIGFNYSQPFLISSAISFVSKPSDMRDRNYGYGLIAATAVINIGIAISTTHYKHHVNRSITAFRGAMVSLIYSKTLELPAGVYDESAALTLMSTDIDRLATSLDSLNEIWARIIEMSIGIWLLERQLGWVCVAPIVIVLIMVFASSFVAKRIGPRQRIWVAAIQRRVGITSSMLGSMKSVKMMGLSDNLFDTLHNLRIRELNLMKKFRVMFLWRLLLSFFPPTLGPLSCFVIFAIKSSYEGSDSLTVGKTFSSLAIISLLTAPAFNFLLSLPMVGMSTGCLDRIQKFLLSESNGDGRNMPSGKPSSTIIGQQGTDGPIELRIFQKNSKESSSFAVVLNNADIPPAPGSSPVLHHIDLQVEKETLTMIIGVVGAGKSTLLKAIIGELKCNQGTIHTESKNMAYCAQTAWLPNSTVRQIVRGYRDEQVEDEEWYQTVLHACAVDEDILLLPDRDDSVIGSRGVTLSGGQKQRLALARAVHSRLNTIVLDDVLSAIDARTENLVVERLLGKAGLLRRMNSTIILATHAVRHLPLADKVVVLGSDGSILEQGTFEDLRSQDGFISKLLLHPELLLSNTNTRVGDDIESKKKLTVPDNKPIRSATVNDTADLTRRIGDLSVYKYYLKAIGWKIALTIASACIVSSLATTFPPLWLTFYSDGSITSLSLFSIVYVVVAIIELVGIAAMCWTQYMRLTPKSGVSLHKILLKTVMRAPQSFFDETDSGITLNRFSQDMSLIDGQLPSSSVMAFWSATNCLGQLALIAVGSSYMAITCPILIIALYFLQNFYLRTSRQMRFLDLEYKSPLYTHFSETLEGLSTIRAFGWQDYFTDTALQHLDISQRPSYLLFCIQRWLNLFLLLLVGITATVVVALATSLVGTTSPGRLGVSLSSVVGFNSSLSWFMLFWIQLETSLGAIARLKGFEQGTKPEDKEEENYVPSEDWPKRGDIEFKNVTAAYGDNPPALNDVSFTIKHGEKIGICGRTGSGKSSLLCVLLRTLDNFSGTITVDNLSLSALPRETIRSRIITIPQEPFIISGTVRLNLDPSTLLPDSLLISSLDKVGLWSILESRGGLDSDIASNPLSQGQQQIFCLARAMLRKEGKILVLDEATSSVDAETDGIMQRLIRESFKEWTILTVAHRLDTIMDSDKILVLDKGGIAENGSPEELMQRKGLFWELRGRGVA